MNSNLIMTEYKKLDFTNYTKVKNLQINSTRYIQNMKNSTRNNQLSSKGYSQNEKIKRQDSCSSQSQLQLDFPEQASVQMPYFWENLSLISSLKPQKGSKLNDFEEKKRSYNEMMKQKEENRKKFIQKMNKDLNFREKSESQIQSVSSVYFINQDLSQTQSIKTNKKSKQQITKNNSKMKRSQTEQNIIAKGNTQKLINFNEFSVSKYSKQSRTNKQSSQKKKIKIKPKQSSNSNNQTKKAQIEARPSQTINISKQKPQSLNASMTKNEFLFLQQYQKDQKEIMDRLLNIIEKDHFDKSSNNYNSIQSNLNHSQRQDDLGRFMRSRQMSLGNSKHAMQSSKGGFDLQFSSLKPIVINNYLKSPTQHFDKGLIEKEIAIRILEQDRQRKRSQICSLKNSRNNITNSILNQTSKKQQEKTAIQKLSSIKKSQIKTVCARDSPIKKQSLQNQELDFEKLYEHVKKKAQKHLDLKDYSFSAQSQKYEETNLKSQLQNIQIQQKNFQSKGQNVSVSNQNTFSQHNVSQGVTQFNPNLSTLITQDKDNDQVKKQSVSLKIFFEQNQANQKTSLADAFKKKFGQKRFQQRRATNPILQNNQQKQGLGLSELKISQNAQNMQESQKATTVKKKVATSVKKTDNLKDKQNINSIQTPRCQSTNTTKTDRSLCTSISKEPSKQLLDRLIYGQKVTLTKKQMYELSKKNYMKLPEIEQKRKIEEKRLKQQERLDKIKQYQKRIRSNKHGISVNSMKTSVQDELNE